MDSHVGTTKRLWQWIVHASIWTSGIGIALLMFPTVADVSYRKAMGPSLPGMVEISEVVLVAIAFLAMAGALHHRVHISTPIFTSLLRPSAAARVRLAGQIVVWVTVALMVWGSAGIALESVAIREFRFGLVNMPIWPAKLAVPIGLFLFLVEQTLQIRDAFRKPQPEIEP